MRIATAWPPMINHSITTALSNFRPLEVRPTTSSGRKLEVLICVMLWMFRDFSAWNQTHITGGKTTVSCGGWRDNPFTSRRRHLCKPPRSQRHRSCGPRDTCPWGARSRPLCSRIPDASRPWRSIVQPAGYTSRAGERPPSLQMQIRRSTSAANLFNANSQVAIDGLQNPRI